MKILYLHQHFSTPAGCGGVRSYIMAKRLLEKGHEVTMVCGRYSGAHTGLTQPFVAGRRRGFVDGLDVIEYDMPYSNKSGFAARSYVFLKFAFSGLRIALFEQYDLLFATTTPLTVAIPGIFARWLRGKRFVFEVRDLWPELPRAMGAIRNPLTLWAMSVLEFVSYRSAHRLIGLSPGIVDGIKRLGVSVNRIAMIPNGSAPETWNGKAKRWRPSQVESRDLMAVFAGTHGLANGLGAVLDTASELKKRKREDIKFILVGQGMLKSALLERAQREGLDNVVFLDPVNKDKLSGLFSEADIGLQILANVPAFYYGTSPNKFFDYISAGLPVLNNYPGWLADIVEKYQCGITVPPEKPDAFANALEWASDNRSEIKRMGDRGRSLAHTMFNINELAEQWVEWVTGGED